MVGNRRLVFAVALVLVTFGMVVYIFMGDGSTDDDTSSYVTDPYTGDELFSDPNQAPETFGERVVSLRGSEELQGYVYGLYFQNLRDQLTEFLDDSIEGVVEVVYVEELAPLESGGVEFRAVVREPIETSYLLKVIPISGDRVDVFIDGELYEQPSAVEVPVEDEL